jgi:hypothetical protein
MESGVNAVSALGKNGCVAAALEVLSRGAAPALMDLFVDSTSIPAHPHAAGAPKKTVQIRLLDAREEARSPRFTRPAPTGTPPSRSALPPASGTT